MGLTTHNLTTGYGHHAVMRDLNLALPEKSLTVLIGANGSGKSTLLRTISRQQPALKGDVILDGRPITEYTPAALARRLALVLTERNGGGGLRVDELVAIGRNPYSGFFGRLSPDDRMAVKSALEAVGMSHKARTLSSSLSDGERQKVMIARAIAQAAPLIILDEPTAFLDVASRFEIMGLLGRLAHGQGRTILLSTHDIAPALGAADHVWAVADGTVRAGSVTELAQRGVLDRVFDAVRFNPCRGDYEPAK